MIHVRFAGAGVSLTPGQRLGRFAIAERLGAGGMGEVWRATDTRLQRDVAIKALPPEFAQDRVRVARFEREAQLLASLNHPNIAAIHGFEEASGNPLLVLELVPGEDLAELLKRGPLPLDEALVVARQIAEALEEAHERGVVHRDLKPANVKLTPDGKVKVLDFGLAKAWAGEAGPGSAPDLSRSPTLAHTSTAAGVILGTAPYMAPEQARGKPVDKRADVWAFGVVLYELLTGRRLFAGETVSDVLAAVLTREPDWAALPAGTPVGVRRLLRRCLERDAKRRLRDIGDARLEIEESLAPPSEGDLPHSPQAAGLRRWLPWIVLAVAVQTAAIVWGLRSARPEAPGPLGRFAVIAPAGVRVSDVALSPDGRTIAFTGTRPDGTQIYVRPRDALEASPLASTRGGRAPFFSPDGEWIGFATGSERTGDAEIRKVPLAGGAPVGICKGEFQGASWGAGDRIVLGSRSGLQLVPGSGGTPRLLAAAPAGEYHWEPELLPDGRAILFYVWTGSLESTRVELLVPETGERRRLLDGSSPRLAPSGHLVFSQAGSLWAVPFDARRLSLAGEPVRVLEGLGVTTHGVAPYALAKDGSLLYAPASAERRRVLVWVDRSGQETPIGAPPGTHAYPRVSPDGTRIVVSAGDVFNLDLWVWDVNRSLLSRITRDPTQDGDPVWSPDGKTLVFHSHRDGAGNIYRQAADGTGQAERLTRDPGEQVPSAVSPDGRWLVFTTRSTDTLNDIFVLALEQGSRPAPLVQTTANEGSATLSPDGRFLAYTSDESGRAEVYVRPFPEVERGKWQVSGGGGQAAVWGPDGRELFFLRGGELRRVSVETAPAFSVGIPQTLFEGAYVEGGIDEQPYDVAPDGRRFVMLKEERSTDDATAASRLTYVVNWSEELRRLAPAR